ncbi:LppX_LprAFG lipoprotein [Leekyejoonella antrihumi]|uniref:LppX_LprAFG lipoprotein n=1 Tax=Leekyejoonella antrihumi TaxID=1660198 RepID=A0A563E915_9MICO|nr:LppX_LprAFG lipoprotein [Leekyejoonella antrihumi]TWP39010.1 LppX_LprAFG lipoprotein [Leekyejoonella antrihumi]
MHARSTNLVTGTLVVAAAVALTGCSSTSGKTNGDRRSSAATAKVVTPMDTLTATKRTMDRSSGMHLVLSSMNVPQGVSAVLSGEGDGSHAPSFTGTLKAQIASISADVPVRAVGGKVYAKLPIWPNMRAIKPSDYGAPDPAALFSTNKGISSLLPQTTDAKFGAKKRDGHDIVQVITGKLPGSAVVPVLAIGKSAATYNVTYEITSDHQLRDAVITGDFFSKAGNSSYELALTKYGEKVDVKAP